ncbi:hypothetical protein IRJ41_025916, partial [Triplophysa rosa]
EGDPVTLNTGFTDIQRNDKIYWSFGPPLYTIATFFKYADDTIIYNNKAHDGLFIDRLKLDDRTGSLTITNLTTVHAGRYELYVRKQQYKKSISRTFVVTITRLPVPVITSYCPQNSSSSSVSTCVLLCSVMNVSHVSFSWYKGKSLLSSISVSDLNIRLSLPLEVEYQDTNTYRCVFNNPITNHTQHLHITQFCHKCSECVCCCNVSEAVIRLVISGLVGVATVAVLAYDIRSDVRDEQKKRSQTPSDYH